MSLNPDAWLARPIVTELHMPYEERWIFGKPLPLTSAQKIARRRWRMTVAAMVGCVVLGSVGALATLVVHVIAGGVL